MTTNANPSSSLKLIPDLTEMASASPTELSALAREQMGEDTTSEMIAKFIEVPEIRSRLEAVIMKRKEKEASRKEQSERQLFADKAKMLTAMLDRELNPCVPKDPVVFLSKEDVQRMAEPREHTLEDRLTLLKKRYGTKLPELVFSPDTHMYAMGVRGALIGVKLSFARDLKRATTLDDQTAIVNKCASLQRIIDVVSEIVREGYKRNPDDENEWCDKRTFNNVILPLLRSDARLLEHSKVPETAEARKAREQFEAEQKMKTEAELATQKAEREQMVGAIMNKMMTVDYFKKLGAVDTRRIAERVAKKFSGSTPESRLLQAANEKCGGDVKPENRALGIALARSAGTCEENIWAMFPSSKEKKEKKQ